MEVLDVTGGPQKIFFNYQGPPAPAVTDTAALASCPYVAALHSSRS